MAIIAKKVQESKTKAIGELKESFGKSQDFIFTDYRGLTVEQITNLRKLLRMKGAEYKVVKNTFAKIAFNQLSTPDISSYIVGPTAVTIAPRDANEAAKILYDFTKEAAALKIKGSLINGVVYDPAKTEEFSKLPGKLELISMLMSVLNGTARNLAAALNDVPARVVRTVKAVADQKGSAA